MSKNKKYMFIMLFILVMILLTINGISYAKYASNSIWNYYLKSKGFYLDSSELAMNSKKNVNNMWDGGSTHFSISNSLNDAVVTETDINYKVTCTIEGENTSNKCYINGTDSDVFEGVLSSYQACTNNTEDGVDASTLNQTACNLAGYNWEHQVTNKDIYFDVVNTDNEEISDITVNITVESTSPYSKTLTGKFILHKVVSNTGSLELKYQNYSDYDRLIVSNSYSDDRCVELSWDATNLAIDVDPYDVSTYTTNEDGYINMIKFTVGGKNSVDYVFYKRNLELSYDSSAFNIVESIGCN